MVKIRLTRVGSSNKRKFRIVVADEARSATGRFIEVLGNLDQTVRPHSLTLDKEKYEAWIAKGAQPTPSVYKLAKQN